MKLEHHLILNRYFHSQFKANNLEKLKAELKDEAEGPSADGQSHFYRAIEHLVDNNPLLRRLPDYDRRIMGYEDRLTKARGNFSFKYFQYLGLLYTEIFLDRLTADPALLLKHLNHFLKQLKTKEPTFRTLPLFEENDLRRLAFFMATGSGKTLILHAHLWQIQHYLKGAPVKTALVRRLDERPHFDNILLITPNEGLSRQHLEEFRKSGIDASLLYQEQSKPSVVKIVEIHKLAEAPSRDGVGIVMDELGSRNLVFVDEGHKGAGSEAQTWKNRQKRLSADGFLVEYSATFAQSVAAVANRRDREKVLAEYGKCILFDYAYRHFYDDGYGKDFQVLNLTRAREDQAFDLLLGGLLVFFHQMTWYKNHAQDHRLYMLEKPLWIFLGSSVNAVFSKGGEKRSDVAVIVVFLKKLLEEPAWAISRIKAVLENNSGFRDEATRRDIFSGYLPELKNRKAQDIYDGVLRDLFHGRGGLELWDLKQAEGEIGLRVSSPDAHATPYFGVINIGDVHEFKKHVQTAAGLEVLEDRFAGSLFSEINLPDSPVSILIGSKKFVEGWSSWRVSAMGLLNMGKGEGPLVIQLFGRGVRLKGKDWSLKRSSALPGKGPHPDGLTHLERLFIFGWNADYIQAFRNMLEQEDLSLEIRVPVQIQYKLWGKLQVPRPQPDYQVESETWTLEPLPLHVHVDMSPRVTVLSGKRAAVGADSRIESVDFRQKRFAHVLNIEALYTELIAYKTFKAYRNVYIPKDSLLPVLRMGTLEMNEQDMGSPLILQRGALMVLKMYLDRFVAVKEREDEGKHLVPTALSEVGESVIPFYTAKVSSADLIKKIETLIKSRRLFKDDDHEPLPRLHVDRHLYNPILLNPADSEIDGITFSPTGLRHEEALFLRDISVFWKHKHRELTFRHTEIYLLRNLPRSGVGFFRHSGCYPDFILWIKDKKKRTTHVVFIEPHGMHHGGLSGNRDKIESLKDLERLSDEKPFQKKKITMKGFILTQTPIQQIPGAEEMNWETLQLGYNIIRQEGDYLDVIFDMRPNLPVETIVTVKETG